MTGQQLKNSILQMAVQGKLVPQDPNDEPASVLVERIRAEKGKLIKEKKIKKEKNPSYIFRGADNLPYEQVGKNYPVCIADEVPFEIPDNWEWVRLRDISVKEIKRGKSPKYDPAGDAYVFAQKCNTKAGNIDMTLAKRLSNIAFEKYPISEYMKDGDIIINSTGNGTLGRIGIFHDSDRIGHDEVVPDSHVTIIRIGTSVVAEYVHSVLKYYQPYLEEQGSGSTNQTELKPESIASLLFPIPPISEQKRIVSKITELKPLVVEYSNKKEQSDKLQKEFPDRLKKSILQWAVQGKLVPQDPSDEPASVLLERIREEKARLVKEGKIKKDKNESIIFRRDNSHYEKLGSEERCIDDEILIDIPDNWVWVRLGTISSVLGGKRIPAGRKLTSTNTGHVYIRVSDMKNGSVNLENLLYVPDDIYPSISRYIIKKDDIYITVAGTIGSVGKIPPELDGANLSENADRLVFTSVNQDWLIQCLSSGLVKDQIAEATTKVGQPKLAIKRIQNLLIPLPPVKEQERIVAKVDKINIAIKQL